MENLTVKIAKPFDNVTQNVRSRKRRIFLEKFHHATCYCVKKGYIAGKAKDMNHVASKVK
jgi:hypothetical protein